MAGDPAAYAAKPSALANPVPGADKVTSMDQYMASAKVPNAQASAAPAPTPQPAAAPQAAGPAQQIGSMDDYMAAQGVQPQIEPGAPQLPKQGPPADPPVQRALYSFDPNDSMPEQMKKAVGQLRNLFEMPRGDMVKKIRENIANGEETGASKWLYQTVLNNTIGLPDQIHDLKGQAIANVGGSSFEKKSLLESHFGKENVQVDKDGGINFRYPGEKDFRPLAPPGFEVLGDTLGNTRQLAKEALMAGPEAATAFLSGGNPLAVTAARAAMQAPANYAVDKGAEALGAKHDENRSRMVENILDTGIEAATGVTLSFLRNKLPGTTEAEQNIVRKSLDETHITNQAMQVVDDAAHVSDSGLFQTVDAGLFDPKLAGQKITLRADQIFTNDAKTMRATDIVKDSPAFQNVQNAQVDNVVSGVKNVFAKISQYTGKSAEDVAENLSGVVKGLDQAEGATIGKFKAKAMAQIGNEKLPVPQELQQHVAGMMQELGFTVKTQETKTILRPSSLRPGVSGVNMPNATQKLVYLPPADMKPLMGKLGITKAGDMRAFVNTLADYANTSGSGLRISEIDRLVNTVGNLNGAAGRNGGQVAAAWGKFSGDLRQFRRDAIGAGLVNDIDIRGYNAAMDKFGKLRDASGTLSKVLDDDFTSNAVVQQVFNKGQAGLQNLRAIKTLVAEDAPQTWAGLKQAWLDDMMRRHSSPNGATPFNFAGMSKELNSYGSTFLNEAFEGSGITGKDVSAMMNVAQQVQSTYRRVGAPVGLDEKAKQGLFNSVVGVMGGMHFKVVNGLQQALGIGMPGNPLNEILNPRDIATRIANYKGAGDKLLIEQNLKKLIATSVVARNMPAALKRADYATRAAVEQSAKGAMSAGSPIAPAEQAADTEQ